MARLIGEMIPSLGRFIYAFVRKEVLFSCEIEGTPRVHPLKIDQLHVRPVLADIICLAIESGNA